MTTVYVTTSNSTLLPINLNDSTYYISDNSKRSRWNFSYKIGRFAGKTTRFFKKKETKVTALLSYWALETLLFALILVSLTAALPIFAALFLYVYGTYAIFAAINALSK